MGGGAGGCVPGRGLLHGRGLFVGDGQASALGEVGG